MERRMIRWRPAHARADRSGRDVLKPQVTLAALAAAAALPLLLLASLLPPPLVLPALSLAALACAGMVAFLAWWRGAARHGERITLWDIAGAAAFIGFAAGMLSDPNQVLHLFDRSAMPR
jgi:hypothetical protein